MREAIISLSSLGLKPEECIRAYHALGREAFGRIKADPYLLCGEGIVEDFTRVDAMAQGLEIEPDSANRVGAGFSLSCGTISATAIPASQRKRLRHRLERCSGLMRPL